MLAVASKTMNVSVPAFTAASGAKRPGESFSDLFLRTFRPTSLLDLAGTLSKEQADELSAAIESGRAKSSKRQDEQGEGRP